MKPTAATVSIASLISGGMLAVDVSVYDGKNFDPVTETIASEQVEVRQVDTVIEAKAPWKGEEGLTVSYDLGQPTLAENLRDRRKEEVIYERVDFGDGGFKIDVLLTEKPDTNRFCYAIEGYENYDFFYQPPLTAEEIAGGSYRPPEIEGSYAVYHKTLKNHEIGKENYATGKVMHIPRPQVWEIGNEEATKQWAELSYENGELCVTAPQDFIDNADYTNGVRIDPTFGYTTLGASGTGTGANTVFFIVGTSTYSGTVTKINIGTRGGSTVSGKGTITLRSDNTLLSNSVGSEVTLGGSIEWLASVLSVSAQATSGIAYQVGAVLNNVGNTIATDVGGSTNAGGFGTQNYVTPGSITGETRNTNLYSVYAEYVLLPIVETFAVSYSAPKTAILRGNVTEVGSTTASNHGFVYGLTSDLLGADTSTSSMGVLTTSGIKSNQINNLVPNRTYYYKFFVSNELGTSFGSILSFNTDNLSETRIDNATIRINYGTQDI